MSEQLLVRLTKLIEQNEGNVFTYTTKHKETPALLTENCLRQVQQKYIIIKEGNKEEDRQEEADVKRFC